MLNGKNVNLRLVKDSDVPMVYALESNLNNRGEYDTLGTLSESSFYKEFHETGFWQERRGTLLITDKEDTIKGSISYYRSVPHFGGYEIGFSIFHPMDRGKGLTTEATKILSAYLFAEQEINRLQAFTISGNVAAIRVLEKAGYKYEGTARQAKFCRGKYYDANLYSLLRDECTDLKDLIY